MGRVGEHNLAFGGQDYYPDYAIFDEVEEWEEPGEEWTVREETLKNPGYNSGSVSVPETQECRPAFTVPLSLNLPWIPWDLRPAEPSSASRESLGFLT